MKRRWYVGSLKDFRMKSGKYRGEVHCIEGAARERVAFVYGLTLAIMRKRKHAIADMLNASEPDETRSDP